MNRRGMALVVALVTLVVLALAAAGAVLAAARGFAAAAERTDALRARVLAASAARVAALAPWPDVRGLPPSAALPGPELVDGPDAAGRAVIRRLAPGWIAVEGDGRARRARAHARVLLRLLELRELLAAFPAAITAASVDLGATAMVDGADAAATPAPWPAAWCDGAADSLAAVFGAARPGVRVAAPAALVATAGAVLAGEPPAEVGPPPLAGATGLGPLDWSRLATIADRTESGTIRLAPAVGAAGCDRTAPGNWGDPTAPTAPCADYAPLVFAPGDLHVAGGVGQGILVVAGDLVLDFGTTFVGPILVAGNVAAASGVALDGALRAGGAVRWNGSARRRACPLVRALTRAPGLARPFRPPGRWWLPAHE
ncbi:MAG: hypothetical protein IRZ00_03100 [Gemmatimonadetes bacterium]|nr:hypothetical protein [Gemmatimonadota bacterium]